MRLSGWRNSFWLHNDSAVFIVNMALITVLLIHDAAFRDINGNSFVASHIQSAFPVCLSQVSRACLGWRLLCVGWLSFPQLYMWIMEIESSLYCLVAVCGLHWVFFQACNWLFSIGTVLHVEKLMCLFVSPSHARTHTLFSLKVEANQMVIYVE